MVILLPQIITICFLFVWFFFSWVDNVNWLPKEFLKSKVSNLSPLSFVMLQMSALETLYHGQFILSTQLIKPNHLFIPPTNAEPHFS